MTLNKVMIAVLCVASVCVTRGQVLETETAFLPKQGTFEADAGFEYQHSSEGSESAIPLLFLYGLYDRLEIAVEPVVYTAIRPKTGAKATGIGDTEVTLAGVVLEEQGNRPAFALAGEVKIPTADNEFIGTQKFDYTGYLILSKHFGQLDAHANVGYQITGQPSGVEVQNVWNFAAAVTYHINDKYDLYAEFLSHTSPTKSGEAADGGPVMPTSGTGEGASTGSSELAGSETVGTIGGGYYVTPDVFLSLSVSYDNNSALLIHPGVTVKF